MTALLKTDWSMPTGEDIRGLFSIIDSGGEHPEAANFIEEIKATFHSELYEPKLARDVPASLRGPYGTATMELKPNAVPCAKKPFRTLGEREKALRELISAALVKGWIRPSKSPWAAQAFVVPKPNNKWRLVIDFRYINSQTKDDPFPLPLIEDLIGRQTFNKLWSIFDLEDGFHQMHLDEASMPLTAFVTPWGQYEWTVLPMGIKNGPAMFQRMIMWILREVPCAVAYIDDVLVGSRGSTTAEILRNHFHDCCQVLQAFRKYKITAKGSKVHLFMQMIKFCGHILCDGTRRAAPSKLQAIELWKPEMIKTITHMRGFLGLAQYYSQYVKGFADIVFPLSEVLKNKEKSNAKVFWTGPMKLAFETIKKELLQNVILQIADPSKPYTLEVDASDYAIGGVLSQTDATGAERPVAFFSRKLQGKPGYGQRVWSVREKETYAIVLILLKYRSWMASSVVHIKVLTDHESLQHWYTEDLNKMVAAVGRRGRWHEFLSQFNIVVEYVKGAEHHVSDALSRWAYPAGEDEADASFHGGEEQDAYARRLDAEEHLYNDFPVSAISTRRGRPPSVAPAPPPPPPLSVFQRPWSYDTCPYYGKIATDVRSGSATKPYQWIDDRLLSNNLICVPQNVENEIIDIYHRQSHPSGVKLVGLLVRRFLFGFTMAELLKRCDNAHRLCPICQAVKARKGPSQGTLDFCPIPADIFSSLCIDFVDLPSCRDSEGKQFDCAMVIVCRLSGYILALPCLKMLRNVRRCSSTNAWP
jgi:hypothetical protein